MLLVLLGTVEDTLLLIWQR